MKGHIRPRGDKFCVVVDVSRKPRKQRWITCETRQEAEAKLAEVLSELNRGVYKEPSKKSLAEFSDEWLVAAKQRLRPSTYDLRQNYLRLHVLPTLGELRLQHVTPALLHNLYGQLLTSGNKRKKLGGGLSPRSVQLVHETLHRMFRDAVRWGYVQSNPVELVDSPKGPPPRLAVWSAEELQRFLECAQLDRLYPAYFLAATTGMRRGEVLGLSWEDLHLEQKMLSVTRTLIKDRDNQPVFSEPKTRAGRRNVFLDAATVEVLRQWPRHLGTGLVFYEEEGDPINPNNFTWRFNRLVKKAGLPHIRLHDLRHTHATLALQAGVHPKVVQERLGHSSIAVTLNTYSHVIPSMQAEAATTVADLVFGANRLANVRAV